TTWDGAGDRRCAGPAPTGLAILALRAPRRSCAGARVDERVRQLRRLALVLVLEIDEGVGPRLLAHAARPARELVRAVVRAPESQVAPVRGREKRRIVRLAGIGDAERRPRRTQHLERLVVEPR